MRDDFSGNLRLSSVNVVSFTSKTLPKERAATDSTMCTRLLRVLLSMSQTPAPAPALCVRGHLLHTSAHYWVSLHASNFRQEYAPRWGLVMSGPDTIAPFLVPLSTCRTGLLSRVYPPLARFFGVSAGPFSFRPQKAPTANIAAKTAMTIGCRVPTLHTHESLLSYELVCRTDH